jgi:hypothetical protein
MLKFMSWDSSVVDPDPDGSRIHLAVLDPDPYWVSGSGSGAALRLKKLYPDMLLNQCGFTTVLNTA